ncbi:hypothetical protein MPSEU_000206200 [Mayamaea pseudoterrestris]|nr:hypothetical protein MPSEU_000206200 [Mayamaea pseudoterrestris]
MLIKLPELTPLPALTTEPCYANLLLLNNALCEQARKIPLRNGDETFGHDFLCLQPAQYAYRHPDTPFVMPAQPAALADADDDMPTNALTERNRKYKDALNDFNTMRLADVALKSLIMAAVPETYYSVLKHALHNYATITTLQLLTHLLLTYANITGPKQDANIQRLHTPWDPNEPIETIWSRITEVTDFTTAAGETLSERTIVRYTLTVLENSGVFNEAVARFEHEFPVPMRTLAILMARFNEANKTRREKQTAGAAGYQDHTHIAALAAAEAELTHLRRQNGQHQRDLAALRNGTTAAPTHVTPATTTTPAPAITPTPAPIASPHARHYCHTHGFGLNYRHTSATCQNPGPNHVSTATADNTMGGTLTEMSPRNPANPRS